MVVIAMLQLVVIVVSEPPLVLNTQPTLHIRDWGDGMVLQHNRPFVNGCGAPKDSVVTVTLHPSKEEASVWVQWGCFAIPLMPRAVMQSTEEAVTLTVSLNNNTTPFATAYGVLFGHAALCRQEGAVALSPKDSHNASKGAVNIGEQGMPINISHAWPCPPCGVLHVTPPTRTPRVSTRDDEGATTVAFGYPKAIPRHIHQTWSGYNLPCPSRWAEVNHLSRPGINLPSESRYTFIHLTVN
jgi:hypothetical protein